jgi:hypothetical protein
MKLRRCPAMATQSIDRSSESSREAALTSQRLAHGLLAQSAEAREAMGAFREKGKPRLRGR